MLLIKKNKKKKLNYFVLSIIASIKLTNVNITTTHPATTVTEIGIHLTLKTPSTIPNPTAKDTKTPVSQTAKFTKADNVPVPEFAIIN